MDLNGNIKIGLKGIETASFWRIRSYDRNCIETLVYVKNGKKIELHPLGITEQSHRRNCLETLFCQIIFLQKTSTSRVIENLPKGRAPKYISKLAELLMCFLFYT